MTENNFEKKPTAAFVATLDMRTKILVSVMATTSAILLNDWRLLAVVNVLTLIYVLSLRRFRPVAVMYIMTALMIGAAFCIIPVLVWSMNALAPHLPAWLGDGFRSLSSKLGDQGFASILLPFMRISVSMNVFLALGLTFDNQEFISVMRKLRLPRIVFIPLMVCCRFVVSFVDDIRQLYESLRVRRRKMNFLFLVTSPMCFLRFLVVPICVRTLRIADDLVLMCEVRRIGSGSRCICAVDHRMRSRDWWVIGITLCAVAVVLTASFFVSPAIQPFSHG